MIKKWVGDGGESHESNTIVDIDNDEEIDEDIKALIPAYLISRQKDIGTIKEAFIKKDMVVIAKLIHNIKGTAISYGQVELDKIAKEVELSLHSNELEKVETLIGEMERLLSKNDGH